MKFAFVIHPWSIAAPRLPEHNALSRANWRQVSAINFAGMLRNLIGADAKAESSSLTAVRVIDEWDGFAAAGIGNAGEPTIGRIYELPAGLWEMIEDSTQAMQLIEEAISQAAVWGAQIIGLGGLAAVLGNQGEHFAANSPVGLTNGNSLAACAAVENLREACRQTDIDFTRATVAVVGVPGAVATAVGRLLSGQVGKLILVCRSKTARAVSLASELGAELTDDLPSALARCNLVVTATASSGCIAQQDLRPGSIVIDLGLAGDVAGSAAERDDVLILEGGQCQVPDTMRRGSMLVSLGHGMIPTALAEPLLLALAGRNESFSLGRAVKPDQVRLIGELAQQHGIDFTRLVTFGGLLEEAALVQYRKAVARQRFQNRLPLDRPESTATDTNQIAPPPRPQDLAARAAERYSSYINPVLTAISGKSGFAKTFVRGEGNYLWDVDGHKYLDFVAGFGSLNLGHNHPRVATAVSEALRGQSPGFTPAAINPYAAALAERLISLAPPSLHMAFFCNSGAESVEAAVKLARLASGRTGLLHCDRSFHGKTLGALSITGNQAYQRPFEPLLSNVASVQFGDLAALEEALSTRQYGAFFVEPIQGEGGMNVPPPGYLRQAQEICRRYGTLLVVDEVQTGLGRTGALFACEHDGVEPDIMTLAKSLGGGLMPIGAMLCRRDLWKKAYGSVQNFALHTSTFGGGSLACAAGLETLRVLEEERLVHNARVQGERLRNGLLALAGELPESIAAVRGEGLLLGLDLLPIRKSIATHWKRNDPTGMLQYAVPNLDGLLESIQAVYLMQTLLTSHGIYTQTARSNPHVLRIQPPLTITAEEVDQFLAAIGPLCHELHEMAALTHSIITKSTVGLHNASQGSQAQLSP
ncbi:MAG: aminotransferase class III-fold pyridoxal phosphate-dependent enzyme [Planctomycetia bacterium]|nr:aminotransferase class III-fold pyridoxal phosphate-dependent enzyme [Planctomycetia bacterium]